MMASHILPTPFTIFVAGYYATFEKQNKKSIFSGTVLFQDLEELLTDKWRFWEAPYMVSRQNKLSHKEEVSEVLGQKNWNLFIF